MTVKKKASHQSVSLLNRMVIVVAAVVAGACLCACDRVDHKPTGSPEKLTIAVVQSLYPALIFIAQSNNYFRDEELDVIVQLHQSGPSALDALIEGKAELASTAETPVMFKITGGDRLTILAQTFASDRELALVARKGQGVIAPADLKGKKIAVTPNTVGEYFLSTYLAVNSIAPDKVEIVKLPPVELVEALLAGKVDAAASWNPWAKKMQIELGDRGISFPLTPPSVLLAVLSSRPDLPSQRPGTVKGFLRALIKAETFAKEKPQESIKIVADAIGMEAGQVRDTWRSEDFSVSLDQSLLINMENEARWAINNRLTPADTVPNFLNYLNLDGLIAVKPTAVTIIR